MGNFSVGSTKVNEYNDKGNLLRKVGVTKPAVSIYFLNKCTRVTVYDKDEEILAAFDLFGEIRPLKELVKMALVIRKSFALKSELHTETKTPHFTVAGKRTAKNNNRLRKYVSFDRPSEHDGRITNLTLKEKRKDAGVTVKATASVYRLNDTRLSTLVKQFAKLAA